jgi:superfamily II DNA helicase RecQ
MQIKIYTIPIPGGESLTEDMNVFLRSKKVLEVIEHVVSNERGAHWCFCIKYLDDLAIGDRQKVDYRQVLDEASFQRFARMRELRKQLALEEAVPPFAIFSDAELAELAKIDPLTAAAMRRVKGIGEKKIEKYGARFTEKTPEKDEKN